MNLDVQVLVADKTIVRIEPANFTGWTTEDDQSPYHIYRDVVSGYLLREGAAKFFPTGSETAFIPAGGTAGQLLSKKSTTEFDVEWKTVSGSSTPTGTGFRHVTAGVEDSAAVEIFSGLAKISVGATAPVGPGTGDLWVDTA